MNMKQTFIVFFLTILFFKTFGQTSKDSLIVFVGQKISVTYVPEVIPNDTTIEDGDTMITNHIGMDSRYIAKYKILKMINGYYKLDTITFYAYDHYGTPAFSKFETVLLFVSPIKEKYYHQKYQYFDLYRTENKKWASPYSTYDYNHPFKKDFTVHPEIIKFKREVSFDLKNLTKEQIKEYYPEPYYIIKKDKAIAIYGNYIEELFILKQQGVFKARGIY